MRAAILLPSTLIDSSCESRNSNTVRKCVSKRTRTDGTNSAFAELHDLLALLLARHEADRAATGASSPPPGRSRTQSVCAVLELTLCLVERPCALVPAPRRCLHLERGCCRRSSQLAFAEARSSSFVERPQSVSAAYAGDLPRCTARDRVDLSSAWSSTNSARSRSARAPRRLKLLARRRDLADRGQCRARVHARSRFLADPQISAIAPASASRSRCIASHRGVDRRPSTRRAAARGLPARRSPCGRRRRERAPLGFGERSVDRLRDPACRLRRPVACWRRVRCADRESVFAPPTNAP